MEVRQKGIVFYEKTAVKYNTDEGLYLKPLIILCLLE